MTRTLLVASTGGHLTQLHQLRPRLGELGEDVAWVTFDTPQSRCLLANEDVVYVDHTGSRDYRHVMTNSVHAARILRSLRVDCVVSTGAAIALSFLPLARTRGIPCHYIESATRSAGPSTTGRLLSRVPGMSLYAQHASWAGGRWDYAGSVFDGFVAREKRFPASAIRRAVVTLGAHRGYGFRRLLDRLVELLPSETEVLWQTGATDVSALPIKATPYLAADELSAAIADADLVIGHAGIGSALCALEAGRCPVLVPREAAWGEHIDDHQAEIADELGDSGIAITRRVNDLQLSDLMVAANRTVARVQQPPDLRLRNRAIKPETIVAVRSDRTNSAGAGVDAGRRLRHG
jgi:UDP-N-acetylglucosamine transferase subunit ALG13